MWECGVLAYLTTGVAGDAAARVRGIDELAELAVGHAGLRGFVGGFVDRQRDVVGELHEGEFGGSLDGAAAEGDWRCAGCCERGAGVGDAVGEDELGALLDADAAGGDAGFFEGLGEELVGVLVFVPGVDLGDGGGGECGGFGFHALADATFFEDGADDEGCAFGGEGPCEEALRLAPAEAGEVVERGAGGDDDGVDAVLVHEGAGSVEALFALGEGDGDGFGSAAGEGRDGGRETVWLVGLLCERQCRC